jgi:SSS family solute:Na+ symporter
MKRISEGNTGLYDYLQNVQGFLAPPITAVFLLGIFNKRINSHGAFYGLVVGFVLGMFKLTVQTMTQSGAIDPGTWLGAIGAFNGYYFAGVLFLVSIVLIIVLSYTTDAPDPARIQGLTFGSVSDEQKAENRASWGWKDVAATVVVLGLVLGVYIYFSTWL